MTQTTPANSLREQREAAGLSQQALGNQVGVTKQAISDFEAGERMPSLATAAAIARVLRSTVDALFLGVPSATASDNIATDTEGSATRTAPASPVVAGTQGNSVHKSDPEPVR